MTIIRHQLINPRIRLKIGKWLYMFSFEKYVVQRLLYRYIDVDIREY